jgi:putative transposase
MQMLIYKCQKNGKDLQVIDERNTSKMCSGCGNLQPMPLHKRTYCCTVCGMVRDRDENSAWNILYRYLTLSERGTLPGFGPHIPTTECGVLQDEQGEGGIKGMPHMLEVQQLTLM